MLSNLTVSFLIGPAVRIVERMYLGLRLSSETFSSNYGLRLGHKGLLISYFRLSYNSSSVIVVMSFYPTIALAPDLNALPAKSHSTGSLP